MRTASMMCCARVLAQSLGGARDSPARSPDTITLIGSAALDTRPVPALTPGGLLLLVVLFLLFARFALRQSLFR